MVTRVNRRNSQNAGERTHEVRGRHPAPNNETGVMFR